MPVHPHREPTRLSLWLGLVFGVVCGGLTALQSRVNGRLADEIGDPHVAAAISFGSGLALLLVVFAFWRPGRAGFARVGEALRGGRLRWWMVLGGVAGAYFVTTQGLAASLLGVAVFTIAIVAGQTIGGVVFDVLGIGPAGRRPLTPTRAAGAVLALVAITWSVSAQFSHDTPVWMMILPFAAGVGAAWQQAVNGRVRSEAHSAYAATLANFLTGTTLLVAVMLVHAIFAGWPSALPADVWLYSGGAIGCVFIAGAAVLVRVMGVLLVALTGVAGQLASAVLLDVLLPTAGRPVDAATVGGAGLAVVAVAVASIRWSRHKHLA